MFCPGSIALQRQCVPVVILRPSDHEQSDALKLQPARHSGGRVVCLQESPVLVVALLYDANHRSHLGRLSLSFFVMLPHILINKYGFIIPVVIL